MNINKALKLPPVLVILPTKTAYPLEKTRALSGLILRAPLLYDI